MTADILTAPAAAERTDDHHRNATASGTCGVAFCEFDALQDAVCGNHGLASMESRDDDSPDNPTDTTSLKGGSGFIEEKLKPFNDEFAGSDSKVDKPSRLGRGAPNDDNPATVSKTEEINSSASSANGYVEKSRYASFMASVDAASKAHGAQSIEVADLYVSMGAECIHQSGSPESMARAKELALLLLEEAFGIYQAIVGDSHERTIDCRVHLGQAHLALGQYDEALDEFCMAVYMREALIGGEPAHQPSVSEIWDLISSVHRARSKLELALKASAKALTGYRSAYGDKHPTVIGVLETISEIHTVMGNAHKAADIDKYVRLHKPKNSSAEF